MDNMIVGQYLPGDSIIHKIDPRLKISALIALLITVFFDAGFIGYLIMGIYVLMIILLSRIPIKRILKSMKAMFIMIIFLMIFNLFLIKTGDIAFKVGPISIYYGAIYQTSYIIIRLLLIISLTTILTATTKPLDLTLGLEHIFAPLKKIGFPSHEIAMMISIALRFIPTLYEETRRIMKAQASRGVDFEEGSFNEKVRAIISLIIPLFISSFQRADDLADAMESRNYVPGRVRTRYHQLKWRKSDTFALLTVILLCICIITLSIIL